MKLAVRLFLVFFVLMLLPTSSLKAQVPVPPQHKSKNNQSVQTSQQVDEQLAYKFLNDKEYDKAADIYQQLYVNRGYYHYFSQYVECLILLEKLDEAEKELKSFIKTDNTTNKWKSNVALAYVFLRKNEKDKSDKILKKLINELPEDKNLFNQIANGMRAKDFNEFAIMLYDRGSNISSMNYKFFMEKAQTYQTMMNFEKATENYLLHLEESPDDYDLVKSRMSFMLRYNIDDSIIDDMRFVLLKKAQDNMNNEIFAELLVWFALQMKDYEIALDQEIALDRRFSDREFDIIYLAKIARDNEQYDIAIKAYDYLVKKAQEGAYYEEAVVGLIEVQYQNVVLSKSGSTIFSISL